MKKYFVLPFLLTGLLLMWPEASQANIAPKKISQVRPIKLTSTSRITIAPQLGQEKKKTAKASPERKRLHVLASKNSAGAKKRGRKTTGKRWGTLKYSGGIDEAPLLAAGVPILAELRQHYQDWQGTRYRAGGSSRAGVDCSGFTALTFREIYGVKLPRSAHDQAMRGIPVGRDGLMPGDLVFFKRPGGDHVGIYMGNDKFMHASTHEGVTISSMDDAYWRNKFWKATRL